MVFATSLMIISMLMFALTSSKLGNPLGRGGGEAQFGTINGKAISQTDYVNARREVLLRYLANTGRWPDPTAEERGFNPETETYFRLMLIQKQKDLGIQVSTEAAADLGRRLLAGFRVDSPEAWEEQVLKPQGMDLGDFDRFLRHEIGLQQLMLTTGVTGRLVTPQEAEDMYRKEHEDLNAQIAYFPASNYVAGVTVSAEDLARFYTNRQAAYVIPNRVQVDYVKFDATNYAAKVESQITNLSFLVDQEFQKFGTNVDLLGKTPEAQKARIRSEIINDEAVKYARLAANGFVNEVSQKNIKDLAGFDALAKEKGLTVHTTKPFDQEQGPSELDVPAAFSKAAFALSSEEPFSAEVPANDGYYALAFRQSYASSIPPLKDVEAKVSADYKRLYATQIARQAASGLANSLTNGLPAGKTFANAAAAMGGKLETLPPFSLSTESLPPQLEGKLDLRIFKQAAFMTPVGKASPFVPTPDGGFVMYIESKKPADEALVKKDLPDFLKYMRQARLNDAFQEWFNQQCRQDRGFAEAVQAAFKAQQERTARRGAS